MSRTITLLKAINEMEKACLSKDCSFTTAANIRENGSDETKKYFQWLRRQTPSTSMFIPEFEALR